MSEKAYNFKTYDEKVVEKIIDDDNLALNHMILRKGEGLPEHFSNSNVYMIITRGVITIKLGEARANQYAKGSIVNIPYNVKMNINNFNDEILEFFVVKAPNPKNYEGK